MTVSVTSSCCEGRELTQVREEILVSRSGSVLWSVLSVQFSVSAHQSSQTSSVYPLSTGRGQLETVRETQISVSPRYSRIHQRTRWATPGFP